MQPDIDDQTSGAKQLGTEPAEVLRWFLVKSELGTEAFGVESPAFDEGVVVGETLKTRQIFALLLQRDLKVMARNRFVKIERLGSGARIGLDTRGVDVKDSRTRTIGRSGPILRGRRSLSEFFDRADFKRRLGRMAKEFCNPRHHGASDRLITLNKAAPAFITARRMIVEVAGEIRQAAGKVLLLAQPLHFFFNARHLIHAELKDLFWRQIRRSLSLDQILVPSFAVGKLGYRQRVSTLAEVFVFQKNKQTAVSGHDALLDRLNIGTREARPVGLTELVGHAHDRLVEQTRLGVGDDHRFDLRQGAIDDDLGLDDADLDAFAHVCNRGVDPGFEDVDPL